MSQQNCWEYKKCGREENGSKVQELGICIASTVKKINGVHNGKNGGRACWAIAGTLCKGAVQGSAVSKSKDCTKCDFYQLVRKQEVGKFLMSGQIMRMLK